MRFNKVFSLLALSSALLIGCTKQPEVINYKYGEDEMYQKLWESKTIYNESVVIIEGEDGVKSGSLIFTPDQIISVKNATLEKDIPSDQYRIMGNNIILTEGSTIPYLTQNNITCKDVPSTISTYDDGKGGKILFTEGAALVMYQINVSYTTSETWKWSVPVKQGQKLPKLHNKLENKEKIRLVVNGDSIFTGANASGKLGIEPFQDTFPDAFGKEITRKYGSDVTIINTAVGGQVSDWGRKNVEVNIIAEDPDLVVIGFGMNDGSWNVSSFDYVDNIEFMVKAIKANCPNAEIIVASTIVANPNSSQYKAQPSYLEPLKEMVDTYEGVVLLDMTTYSLDLLKVKSSFDLYANNINHPCDFMVRQYVANLMNIIEK